MTQTYFTTGDAARDEAIANVIHALMAEGQQVTRPLVAAKLPVDFGLTNSEVRGIYGEIIDAAPVTFEEPAADESLRDVWPPSSVTMPVETDPAELKWDRQTGGTIAIQPRVAQKIVEPSDHVSDIQETFTPASRTTDSTITEQPKAMTQPEAFAALTKAQAQLAERRRIVRVLTSEVQETRGKLLKLVGEFMADAEGTPEERRMAAVRDYVATSQAMRAARVAQFGTGVSQKANAFVRKQMQHGGAREGISQAARARTGFTVPGSPAAIAQAAARAAKVV